MKLIQGSKNAGGRSWVQSTLSYTAMTTALTPRFARKRLSQFATEDDGTSTFMTFYVFLAMMIMAGLGIDTMRHEMERTHLQATLDSAVLAGAGAPLGSEVEYVKSVVEDYFTKNDMYDYLHELDTDGEGEDDIVTSLNATKVFAEVSVEMDTYLMDLVGVKQLKASGAAGAEVRTPKLEVSVVLDVSGSMRGTKLDNLQEAAKSFVTTILNNTDPGNAVISIVPFSWNVTPGVTIYEALSVNEKQPYSNCILFEPSDYSKTEIDPDHTFDQQIFTSVYGSFDNLNDSSWRSCYTDDEFEILPYSMSETALHAHIDGLEAGGNTSAHIGMKWGAALLDDEFQDVFDALQDAKEVNATLANIPATYGESETLKVIVLMADGQNTNSYYFNENSQYRGPNSDLIHMEWQQMVFQYAFRQREKGGTKISYNESKCSNPKWECVYEATGNVVSAYYLKDGSHYYDIRNDDWLDHGEFQQLQNKPGHQLMEGSPKHLTWEEAWGFMSPDWFGDVTGNWGPYNDYRYQERVVGSTKDAQMQAICTATKAEDVVVYTIGYDISTNGNAEVQLRNCASTGNHYYPTNGADISAAFNSIASNVQNLRLTQ